MADYSKELKNVLNDVYCLLQKLNEHFPDGGLGYKGLGRLLKEGSGIIYDLDYLSLNISSEGALHTPKEFSISLNFEYDRFVITREDIIKLMSKEVDCYENFYKSLSEFIEKSTEEKYGSPKSAEDSIRNASGVYLTVWGGSRGYFALTSLSRWNVSGVNYHLVNEIPDTFEGRDLSIPEVKELKLRYVWEELYGLLVDFLKDKKVKLSKGFTKFIMQGSFYKMSLIVPFRESSSKKICKDEYNVVAEFLMKEEDISKGKVFFSRLFFNEDKTVTVRLYDVVDSDVYRYLDFSDRKCFTFIREITSEPDSELFTKGLKNVAFISSILKKPMNAMGPKYGFRFAEGMGELGETGGIYSVFGSNRLLSINRSISLDEKSPIKYEIQPNLSKGTLDALYKAIDYLLDYPKVNLKLHREFGLGKEEPFKIKELNTIWVEYSHLYRCYSVFLRGINGSDVDGILLNFTYAGVMVWKFDNVNFSMHEDNSKIFQVKGDHLEVLLEFLTELLNLDKSTRGIEETDFIRGNEPNKFFFCGKVLPNIHFETSDNKTYLVKDNSSGSVVEGKIV